MQLSFVFMPITLMEADRTMQGGSLHHIQLGTKMMLIIGEYSA
jgi:hypothetical protein